MDRNPRRLGVLLALGLLLLQLDADPARRAVPTPVPSRPAEGRRPDPPARPGSNGLDELLRASSLWRRRAGPERQVVDAVCLVPDLATFLEAIAAWDETHAFPILIDDVELTFKFVRAFRPARVIRYPRRVAPIPADRLWDAALAAVARSWSSDPAGADREVPSRLGPTPPGLVLSAPSSPTLAGAVALAAGRFQRLIRWDPPRRFGAEPTQGEAVFLANGLEAEVAKYVKSYDRLGDDCDFLTLAGDWPYRYRDKVGPAAFDDLVGRSIGAPLKPRWAFTGRLLGDTKTSLYRAMCSLFVQPDEALLFNTYTDPKSPWTDYALAGAADRLARVASITLREGDGASLAEWSEVVAPINRFGLVLLNTQGGATEFHLPGGPGQTADIPPSVPSAVVMIHSFSAEDPTDPRTIAGRWLSNGAFVYFGAMHEPFLNAFRTPRLVSALVGEGVPLGAALRQNAPEAFHQPWRLVYLGDPLFVLRRRERRPPRLVAWGPLSSWPACTEAAPPPPAARSSDASRLTWALETALVQLQSTDRSHRPPPVDLPTVLLAIRREGLDAPLRPLYDALLIDTLLQANRPDVLLDRLEGLPAAGASSPVARTRESLERAAAHRRGRSGPGPR
jgi:hypothetical protein